MNTVLGITFMDWWRLLKDNSFQITGKHWHKAAFLSIRALSNSRLRKKEEALFGERIQNVTIDQHPIFILGHWRSGTTLLHQFFSLDQHFAFPNLLEVYNPHTFLHLEPIVAKKLQNQKPQKRPMDNVEVTYTSPAEDEFALAVLSLRSPLLAWPFPRRAEFYDRYLTFYTVSQPEIEIWQDALLLFVRKLTLKYNRRIVLKSPSHTGRVKLLLKMFPKAKFVHLHRNPYAVFSSTQHLYETAIKASHLQSPKDNRGNKELVIRRYATMYDAFFSQRGLIPQGNFVEACFEDLEKDPIGQMRYIYDALDIGDFNDLKPCLQQYVKSKGDYKKNAYSGLTDELRSEIAQAWQRSFEAWGYDMNAPRASR